VYVLYRETGSGVFELCSARHFSDVLEELVRRHREGERGALVIKSDQTGELVFRSAAALDGVDTVAVGTSATAGRRGVDFGVSVLGGAIPSQHVQVKSAVKCQFGTVGAGETGSVFGVGRS
jgi:hypothetical protein